MTDAELQRFARLAVHAEVVPLTDRTFCSCRVCERVARAFTRVAADARAGAELDRDLARTASLEAQQRAALAAIDVTVATAATGLALAASDTLCAVWRALAVSERAAAASPRSMSPTWRSIHLHQAGLYDRCAAQLTALHKSRP